MNSNNNLNAEDIELAESLSNPTIYNLVQTAAIDPITIATAVGRVARSKTERLFQVECEFAKKCRQLLVAKSYAKSCIESAKTVHTIGG